MIEFIPPEEKNEEKVKLPERFANLNKKKGESAFSPKRRSSNCSDGQ